MNQLEIPALEAQLEQIDALADKYLDKIGKVVEEFIDELKKPAKEEESKEEE